MRVRNLIDPSYEPTDNELVELMHSAFSGVQAQNLKILQQLHASIAEKQRAAMARAKEKYRGHTKA